MVEEFQKCELQSKVAEQLSAAPQTTIVGNEHS